MSTPSSDSPEGEDRRLEHRAAVVHFSYRLRDMLDAFSLTQVNAEGLRDLEPLVDEVRTRLLAVSRQVTEPSAFDPIEGYARAFNPASGPANPFAPPLRCWQIDSERFDAECTLTSFHEGPEGFAHGGVTALMIDQLVGYAATCAIGLVYTASLTVNYMRPVPLGQLLHLSSRIAAREGRKIRIDATLCAATRDAETLASAQALLLRRH